MGPGPRVYRGIDWSQGWKSLDKDLTKLLPDSEAGNRWADKLVQVHRRDEQGEQIVFLHVEFQNDRKKDFELRMFTTNYRVFDRLLKPVVSLGILGDDSSKWRPKRYGWKLWGCEMRFRFPIVKLRSYNRRWRRLEKAAKTNPVAVAVMAHLKNLATRKDPEGRYREKLALIRRLYESKYERDDIVALLRFIDWVMRLPEDLKVRLDEDLQRLEKEKKVEYVTTWERHGIEKGIEKGLVTGRMQGKADVLMRQLGRRFGELPEWTERRLAKADAEKLDRWSDRILDAEDLADVLGDAP